MVSQAAGIFLGVAGRAGLHRLRKPRWHCHSEEPAGDEESVVAWKFKSRSFVAAQDDSLDEFFRSLLNPALPSAWAGKTSRAQFSQEELEQHRGHTFTNVTAPSEAEETNAAYLENTPRL